VGIVAIVIVALGTVVKYLVTNGISGLSDLRGNATLITGGTHVGLGALIVGVLISFAVLWVFLLGSAFFLRRSYDRLATRLNTNMFRTAALLYLIGAVLTIILVGLVLVWVASILQMIAFFQVPDQVPGQEEKPVPMTVPPPPPSSFG
jgi:uncharacterized membrane protein